MKWLRSFLAGLLVGVLLTSGMLKYHWVRGADGSHLIPKSSPQFSGFYVDIREFTVEDWQQHPELAVAIAKSGNRDLLNEAAQQSIRQSAEQWLQGIGR